MTIIMIASVHSIYSQSVHAPALNAGSMDNDARRYSSKKSIWIHVEKFKREQQKIHSQTPCGITFHMNTHACTLFPHNNINIWMHVEYCEHKQQKNPLSNPV